VLSEITLGKQTNGNNHFCATARRIRCGLCSLANPGPRILHAISYFAVA
jgi:hypothetical protein